ncbi:thiamine pyrophosphate-binding protein [Nonomuraea sp. NPDC050202]|uniref:thiamine pyrophosphate-binding protein n=1 Tax=Nonomuraea sp. NPDC050202 TaxID=3155035 RepID=UPI0033CDF320
MSSHSVHGEPAFPAAAFGAALASLGIADVFTTAGEDTAALAAALTPQRVRVVAARQEAGAVAMAGGSTLASGRRPAVLVLTASDALAVALPGILDAVTSRTPLLVFTPPTRPDPGDRVLADLTLADAAGALTYDLPGSRPVGSVVAEAARVAEEHLLPVVVRLPDTQACGSVPDSSAGEPHDAEPPMDLLAAPMAAPAVVEELAQLLSRARRPVFLAGRGSVRARAELEALAEQAGALLATSAAACGLFTGNPWSLGIAGVLAPPDMAELLAAADVVMAWGCSLDAWTTRHGQMAPKARLAQIDLDPAALGLHQRIDVGVLGDCARTAHAVQQALPAQDGYRTQAVRHRIATRGHWHDIGYQPMLEPADRIDPRTLTLALDAVLPDQRTLTVEHGHLMGHPLSYLRSPDAGAFRLAGSRLGLASGIGAALARPDRLAVTTLGLGSALTTAADLESAARLRARLLIVVYDEDQEQHLGEGTTEQAADLTLIAAGHGCPSIVVRRAADLSPLADWLAAPERYPLLLHAHITPCRWWADQLTDAGTS